MDTIRTFTAVDLDKETKSKISRLTKEFRDFHGKINLTLPENLHITLNFLGDVPSKDTHRVCKIVEQAAADFSPFEFTVTGFVPVERRGRIEMIWAGITDRSGTITAIQDRLNTLFAEEGFRAENRKFTPHLTIARIKSTSDAMDIRKKLRQLADIEIASLFASKIVVYTSMLTSKGPVYTPLSQPPLGK